MTDILDESINKVMAQIAEAATKPAPDLQAIQRLTRKATELQEVKEQSVAIQQRIAALSNEVNNSPAPTNGQPTSGKNRQLLVEVTDGMIRQNLLTLTRQVKSGKIKVGEELTIEASPSGRRFRTILMREGKKLRERGEIAQFYRDAKVNGGDYVILAEIESGHWTLKKAPPGQIGLPQW